MVSELHSPASHSSVPVHKQYPIVFNGIQLGLGGLVSALALVSPRKSLNLYDNPASYLCVSAFVMLAYYALLAFFDVYCFKARGDSWRPRARPMSVRISSVLSMVASTLAASLVIALGFVLFGAPATTHYAETLTAALNVSLLAVTPAILTLTPSFGAYRRALLSAEQKSIPEKWASGFFWCTISVTWASAYFIPMDWERLWQKWPIPVIGGAFLGNMVGVFFVLVRCFVVPIARADFEETQSIQRQMARDYEAQRGPVTRSMAKKDK
ncbi:hypothetical protein GGH96_001511 [Coemansia sp. RSA 1972]|nr:hypothetical protein GGH96_001511 [Coemansia sp. RSA 1972]